MSTENFTISIQGDSEGYVTFECPYCNSEFKLQAGEYQNDDEPFEEKMDRLTSELAEMFAKSHELEDEIRKKLGVIGYELKQ